MTDLGGLQDIQQAESRTEECEALLEGPESRRDVASLKVVQSDMSFPDPSSPVASSLATKWGGGLLREVR